VESRWNLTGRLGLVGDDATDEMGRRGAERRHQVIQLLLLLLQQQKFQYKKVLRLVLVDTTRTGARQSFVGGECHRESREREREKETGGFIFCFKGGSGGSSVCKIHPSVHLCCGWEGLWSFTGRLGLVGDDATDEMG